MRRRARGADVGLSRLHARRSGIVGGADRRLVRRGGGVIRIERCGAEFCGMIVGLGDAVSGDAKSVDVQGRPLCGLVIMNDLAEIESNIWRGRIVDPNTGRRCGSDISRDDRLRLQRYIPH